MNSVLRRIESNRRLRLATGFLVLAIMISGIGLLARPTSTESNKSSTIPVIAAENFYGNMASQLGGKYVSVNSLITSPTADPHLYESDAHDAALVYSAKLAVYNGLGYDSFMSKLLVNASSKIEVVKAASVLSVTNPNANPHLWYDLLKVPKLATAIEAAYIKLDPIHASYYKQQLALFNQQLKPSFRMLNIIKDRFSGYPVAYTEPVPQYLLNIAGLNIKTPTSFALSVEDGVEPSPGDTLIMDNLITNHKIKLLLYNTQTVSPVTNKIKALAIKSGIPVVGVSETMPQNTSYQQWQYSQLASIYNALKGVGK